MQCNANAEQIQSYLHYELLKQVGRLGAEGHCRKGILFIEGGRYRSELI